MRYRVNGLVVAVRCALLGAGLIAAGCGGGGGGGSEVLRPSPPPTVVTPPPAPPAPVVLPPNPQYSQHLFITNASAAHQAGLTGQGVRIGVVDSGVMRNHPALAPRVVANLNYVSSPPNNLTIDDVVGHGTGVSQIMAGTAFGAWPGGIAPGAQIVSARIIADKEPTDDGSGNGNEVDGPLGLKGIHQDLINRGVRVMNNSWGGLYWTDPAATAPIADEYRPFITTNNGLVVFATGNESRANPSSMAALPSQPGPNGSLPAADLERGWIAVTAVNPNNIQQLDSGSSGVPYANACGVAMRYCMAAPGTVVVTGTNDSPTSPTYWSWKGTSLAAPQVSGAAALVWQAFPYFSNDVVRQTLLGTAKDIGDPGVDAVFGHGLLDVGAAVKGPSNLHWGDLTVQFDDITSTWSNNIRGDGGIIKQGTGTLKIAGWMYQRGRTQVLGGTLDAGASSFQGDVLIGPQGRLILRGGSSADVENQGRFDVLGTFPVSDYIHGANARLALNVGDFLNVMGTAQINGGDVHVLGIKSGYTWTSREAVLKSRSLTGRFNALTAAPGVFLDATLSYDPTTVWLDIARLNVTAAAQSMGLSAMSVSSAQRVEDAFAQIDEQQRDGSGTTIDDGFLGAAGAIQGAPTAAAAEQTLASLSGELHGNDSAFALMAIEGNRRALESRVDALLAAPVSGAWADSLRMQRATAHFDVDADGWMLGLDRRQGERLTLGAAVSETEGYAWHDQRFDRERNRQVEGQFYAAYDLGRSYLLGTLAVGNMQRWTQRDVLLGADQFRIATHYSDRYATLGMQTGLPIRIGSARITPYAGVQALQLDREGFSEDGAAGFGLSTAGSSMSATQALFGVRMGHEWRAGTWQWTLQGRAEWQHLLSQSGSDIDARFTGLDVWSPILGQPIDDDVGVFGVSLQARFGRRSMLGFDLDTRHAYGDTYSSAMATWSMGF